MVGCQVAFAIGAWNIMTARRIRVPMSHIHIVVGMFSVRVARRVPELSKDTMFVPVFASELTAGEEPDVGGHIV